MTPDIDLDALGIRAQEVLDDAPDSPSEPAYLARGVLAALSALTATRAELGRANRELNELRAHECVPTQDAYDKACAALWKHRGRADTAEGERNAARAEADILRAKLAEVRRLCDRTIWILNANDVRAVLDAAPAAAPQPDGPGHCGLCGREDCPGVPGKGCTPGPFETVEPACGALGPNGMVCVAPAGHAMAHYVGGVVTTTWTNRDMAAGAGDGEQDTATTEHAVWDHYADCTTCGAAAGKPCVRVNVQPGHYRSKPHWVRALATTASGQGAAGEEGTA